MMIVLPGSTDRSGLSLVRRLRIKKDEGEALKLTALISEIVERTDKGRRSSVALCSPNLNAGPCEDEWVHSRSVSFHAQIVQPLFSNSRG